MNRKIYDELLKWKNSKEAKPLMVLGVRQCGKTYIINEFCSKEYAHYKYINLFEEEEVIKLYNTSLSSDEKFTQLKTLLNFDLDEEDSILFIDEIQESEALISELKYFCEKRSSVRIICAGSLLGVKLKRMHSSFPVGKVKMLRMYPMDFEEFLEAANENLLIDLIKKSYNENKSVSESIHNKALLLFRNYLLTGGMPDSVKNLLKNDRDYIKYDQSIIGDILDSYFNDMKQYVTSENESLKIERLYRSLPSQLANQSNKFQYSKITKNARAREYETSLDWLVNSNLVLMSKQVSVPEIPLEGFIKPDTFKLYLSDNALLNNLLGIPPVNIITDNISLYKGIMIENYVASELNFLGHRLYYWGSDNTSKVDFLIYTKDGVVPIEVKASDNTKAKSLKQYMNKYNPSYAIRISTKNFGFNVETKIKSVPLYATFCIKKEV